MTTREQQVTDYCRQMIEAWSALFAGHEPEPRKILTAHYTNTQIAAVYDGGRMPEYEIQGSSLFETHGLVPPAPSMMDFMRDESARMFAQMADSMNHLLPAGYQLDPGEVVSLPKLDAESKLLTATKIAGAFQAPLEMVYPERFVYVPIKRSIWYRLNAWRRDHVWAVRSNVGHWLLGDRDDDYV